MVTGTQVLAAAVPDTGQTTCYDESGNMITCSRIGNNGIGFASSEINLAVGSRKSYNYRKYFPEQ